jgi:hypothetical protein
MGIGFDYANGEPLGASWNRDSELVNVDLSQN